MSLASSILGGLDAGANMTARAVALQTGLQRLRQIQDAEQAQQLQEQQRVQALSQHPSMQGFYTDPNTGEVDPQRMAQLQAMGPGVLEPVVRGSEQGRVRSAEAERERERRREVITRERRRLSLAREQGLLSEDEWIQRDRELDRKEFASDLDATPNAVLGAGGQPGGGQEEAVQDFDAYERELAGVGYHPDAVRAMVAAARASGGRRVTANKAEEIDRRARTGATQAIMARWRSLDRMVNESPGVLGTDPSTGKYTGPDPGVLLEYQAYSAILGLPGFEMPTVEDVEALAMEVAGVEAARANMESAGFMSRGGARQRYDEAVQRAEEIQKRLTDRLMSLGGSTPERPGEGPGPVSPEAPPAAAPPLSGMDALRQDEAQRFPELAGGQAAPPGMIFREEDGPASENGQVTDDQIQALIARFQAQGLEGDELERAVLEAIGGQP